jgi:uncharacterized membrane protein
MDDMRNGAGLALVLAMAVVGCGERADPVPGATDSPAAVPSEATPISEEPAAAPAPTELTPVEATPASAVPGSAAKAPVAAPIVPAKVRALGTEPFWNAQIHGEALTYTTPENQKGQRATLVRRDQANGAEFSGKLGGAAIHVAVTKRTCSDGMSDRSYPFTVVLTLGSDRREGCAS